ncbi:hypothetical protein [Streptomyces sp. H39-S7]|uniref:hypothetical protein n=1 Tax=Streptomyces sp. H39-S7 TaxID=3004357 RepID=UPI0022B02461|nr:hypothetical protein [Streptomyces sp. H39-S7]MCZ4123191.1 hypothetical protein [Streptomyces sp. H39-S7]
MTRRMLLFAALLLGIFAMHTVGHPAGGVHGDPRPSAAGRPFPPAQHAAPHHGMAMAPAAAVPRSHPPAPAHGTSPLAVCLAVLGTGAVALLVVLGLKGAPLSASVAAARSLLPRSRRPWPPAPPIPLSRLPVLRI